MGEVSDFTGVAKNTSYLYGCTECGCRSFKFYTFGASKEVKTYCANCEEPQNVKVEIDV